jgi:cyclopropane-fatty-acyl-phospholipid synthase
MSPKLALDRMLRQLPSARLAVDYWDGDKAFYGDGLPQVRIRVEDAATLARILDNPTEALPEAYVAGTLQVEGDLQHLLRLGHEMDPQMLLPGGWQRLGRWIARRARPNSANGARINVSHHYDMGNDFFKLWLDREMNYSCAYFETPHDDIDTAQRQKLQHICAKLRLTRGQRLLDVGCGWGALAIHAAREHGASVVGITLSAEQMLLAQARVRQLGLDPQVQVRLQDYRALGDEKFDAVASVGMIEHVGRAYLPRYVQAVAHALRRGCVGVFQFISHSLDGDVTPWIGRHIFPGMYLPPLHELAAEMARVGLCITDVENLKPHYAMTLDAWIRRFEENERVIRTMFDERFIRMWAMYLNSASAAFKYGDLNLWQITFTRGAPVRMPLTRRHIYERHERVTQALAA